MGPEEVWAGRATRFSADLDSRCFVSLTVVGKTSLEALVRDE